MNQKDVCQMSANKAELAGKSLRRNWFAYDPLKDEISARILQWQRWDDSLLCAPRRTTVSHTNLFAGGTVTETQNLPLVCLLPDLLSTDITSRKESKVKARGAPAAARGGSLHLMKSHTTCNTRFRSGNARVRTHGQRLLAQVQGHDPPVFGRSKPPLLLKAQASWLEVGNATSRPWKPLIDRGCSSAFPISIKGYSTECQGTERDSEWWVSSIIATEEVRKENCNGADKPLELLLF